MRLHMTIHRTAQRAAWFLSPLAAAPRWLLALIGAVLLVPVLCLAVMALVLGAAAGLCVLFFMALARTFRFVLPARTTNVRADDGRQNVRIALQPHGEILD